eukprot:PhF_6_TR26067/c0_g1_i2/m.36760/K00356/E1.6.99.3; NADH dehydrogenase
MKSLQASGRRTLIPATTTSLYTTQQRNMWDPSGHQPEALFLDRKDLSQMYPTVKPRVTGGGYGHNRAGYWNLFIRPQIGIRFPHERRYINARPASVVTVYGASGYLGSRIARLLIEDPRIKTVRLCTRYPTLIKQGSELDKLIQMGGAKVELHECDITDRIQVNVAANGADTLIMAVDYFSEYSTNSHYDVFVTGGTNVAWTGRCVRAERVILCNGLDATFASESNYVDMRARGEEAVGANFFDTTVLRFGPLYGDGYRYRGLGKYIYPCVYSKTNVQPTWVGDAARAVVRTCFSTRALRHKFDLGGPETMSHIEMMRKMSDLYSRRFIFPMSPSVGLLAGKIANWSVPNPWFDDNWMVTFELDNVNRSPAMFDSLSSWDRLAYTPLTMEEARQVELGAKTLSPMWEMDKQFQELEKQDKRELQKEEEDAKLQGLFRAKAEPGLGQKGNGWEHLANEIYPGSQFRSGPLKDAPYPKTAPHPGWGAVS